MANLMACGACVSTFSMAAWICTLGLLPLVKFSISRIRQQMRN